MTAASGEEQLGAWLRGTRTKPRIKGLPQAGGGDRDPEPRVVSCVCVWVVGPALAEEARLPGARNVPTLDGRSWGVEVIKRQMSDLIGTAENEGDGPGRGGVR